MANFTNYIYTSNTGWIEAKPYVSTGTFTTTNGDRWWARANYFNEYVDSSYVQIIDDLIRDCKLDLRREEKFKCPPVDDLL